MGIVLVGTLAWAACVLLTTLIAAEKSYPARRWGLLAMLVGPLALVGACGLPDLELRRLLQGAASHAGEGCPLRVTKRWPDSRWRAAARGRAQRQPS